MAEKVADIRIVKKRKGHGGHHGGAWKVAYADFVTAMMAFFMVMWIIGLSKPVKENIAGYFKDPSKYSKAVAEGKNPLAAEVRVKEKPSGERQKLEEAKKTIEKMVAGSPEFKQIKKYIDIKIVDEGMRIDLLEAKESLFFDSASAQIKPSAKMLLAKMASECGKLPNKVIIEGHTDNRPLNRDGYTNWELSADRANSARNIMESSGLERAQIAQVRGYADTQPRNPEDPSHFSNRRVSIIVVMKSALKKAQFSGGEASPSEESEH